MRAKGEDCANKWSMCDDHIKGLNFSVEDVLYEWVSGGVSRSLESKSNSGGFQVSGCFSHKEHKGRKVERGEL